MPPDEDFRPVNGDPFFHIPVVDNLGDGADLVSGSPSEGIMPILGGPVSALFSNRGLNA